MQDQHDQSNPQPLNDDEPRPHREEVRLPDPEADRELTEEQIRKMRATGLELMQKHIGVGNACINLVIARRLYNVALQSLNRAMDDLQKEQAIELFLIDAMKHQAAIEFTREDLLDHLSKSTLPWLVAEINSEKDRELQAAAEDVAKEEIARRQQQLPLVFEPGNDWAERYQGGGQFQGFPAYNRARTLTLAGHPRAVGIAMDLLASFAMKIKETVSFQRPTVLRLTTEMINHNVAIEKESQPLFKVGINRWLDCGRSVRAIWDTLRPFYGMLVRSRVDICLIDDLSQCKQSSVEMEPWYLAGVAQKTFRKWADEAGCCLVAGVPFVSANEITKHWDGIDINHAKWNQLNTYTDLVELHVEEDKDDTYKITAKRPFAREASLVVGGIPREQF